MSPQSADGARGPYTGVFLDNCHSQEQADFPKARKTLMGWSDEQLAKEQRAMLRASFNPMFGHNATKMLEIIEAEIKIRSNWK